MDKTSSSKIIGKVATTFKSNGNQTGRNKGLQRGYKYRFQTKSLKYISRKQSTHFEIKKPKLSF